MANVCGQLSFPLESRPPMIQTVINHPTLPIQCYFLDKIHFVATLIISTNNIGYIMGTSFFSPFSLLSLLSLLSLFYLFSPFSLLSIFFALSFSFSRCFSFLFPLVGAYLHSFSCNFFQYSPNYPNSEDGFNSLRFCADSL